MSIFKEAVKSGLVFTTSKGQLLPQDLYKLPLTGNNGFNLDEISKSLLRVIKDSQEESLISVKTTGSKENELRLEILKEIIKDKQDDIASKTAAASKAAKDAKIKEIISRKKDKALEDLDVSELEKLLEE